MRRIGDALLAFLQRKCSHPGNMVAADLLEGCVDGLQVKWCCRCGAICTEFDPTKRYIPWAPYPNNPRYEWRRPDPNLSRGK